MQLKSPILLNLVQMLGLVSEWFWQRENGSKYFISFKLFGLSAQWPFDTNLLIFIYPSLV